VREFTPEAVAHLVPRAGGDDPAHRARLRGNARASIYGRIGLCNQEFGTLASWLVDVVNIITGHFDVEGGSCGASRERAVAWLNNTDRTGRRRSGGGTRACRAHPKCSGRSRRRVLAEEIADPGPGRSRRSSRSRQPGDQCARLRPARGPRSRCSTASSRSTTT
jgi:hypothetical protein